MFNVYQYSLPFHRPFKTGSGTFLLREGLILRYSDHQIDLISETAPLPGFSVETLPGVIDVLKAQRSVINSFLVEKFTIQQLDSFLDKLPNMPSLQFGLSSLGLIMIAERKGQRLPSLLNRPLNRKILLNAVTGASGSEELKAQVKNLYQTGVRFFKIKVPNHPQHLPNTLIDLTSAFPDLTFRLDANRSWNFSTIEQFSEQFSKLNVEYIEEPVKLMNVNQYQEVLSRCKLPVAADESIPQFGLSNLISLEHMPSFFILKPMFVGNLIKLIATITSQSHLEDRFIFTTALESIAGRKIISLIAGMYGSKVTAHGLYTGILFSEDLTLDNSIIKGVYCLKKDGSDLLDFKSLDSSKLEKLF